MNKQIIQAITTLFVSLQNISMLLCYSKAYYIILRRSLLKQSF